MQLKRKRSDSELSTLTTSTFNSPSRGGLFSPAPANASMNTDSFSFTSNFPVSPLARYNNKNLQFSHVPGRTMKRFRDNRPSEYEVHQRTLNILYSAQRQSTHATHQEIPTISQPPHHNAPVAAQPGSSSSLPSSSHQTSLHSFWKLPSRPSVPPAACLPPTVIDIPTECEDCGQKLGGDDDVMMEIDDVLGTAGIGCGACGKHVCSHCSISNLGEQRRCLGCADAKVGKSAAGAGRIPWSRGMSSWLC